MSTIGPPPRYQVFLSSTYEDLREERQQATQAILEMGHFPAGMELFPASDQTQADLIRRIISESDYYILILAGRYGSTDLTGLSYTEMEYDWAIEFGLPVLSFVRRTLEEIPNKWSESDPVKKTKLEGFRQKVMTRHVRLFDTASELGMQVMKSLMNESRINPRIGWIRADQLPAGSNLETETELRDELKIAKRDIKRLERALRDTKKDLPDIDLNSISCGSDTFPIKVLFQNKNKQQELREVHLTWDEIFSTIAPSMYGYIQRRFSSGLNQPEIYKFEDDLIDVIRMRILEDVSTRTVRIFSHQIDTILIQFQQLGYISYVEKDKGDDKESFRGYTLTEAGELYLTRIQLTVKSK